MVALSTKRTTSTIVPCPLVVAASFSNPHGVARWMKPRWSCASIQPLHLRPIVRRTLGGRHSGGSFSAERWQDCTALDGPTGSATAMTAIKQTNSRTIAPKALIYCREAAPSIISSIQSSIRRDQHAYPKHWRDTGARPKCFPRVMTGWRDTTYTFIPRTRGIWRISRLTRSAPGRAASNERFVIRCQHGQHEAARIVAAPYVQRDLARPTKPLPSAYRPRSETPASTKRQRAVSQRATNTSRQCGATAQTHWVGLDAGERAQAVT